MLLEDKQIKVKSLLRLDEIESPMLIIEGEFNLFLIKKDRDELGSRNFIMTLKKGDSFDKIEELTFDKEHYIFAIVPIFSATIKAIQNFDFKYWQKKWKRAIVNDFNLEAEDYDNVFLAYIIEFNKKQAQKFNIREENANITKLSLSKKIKDLGNVASISLNEEQKEEKKLNSLYLCLEEIAEIYKLNFEKNKDILLDESLSVFDRVEAFSLDSNWRVRKVSLQHNFYKEDSLPILAFRKSNCEAIVISPRATGTTYYSAKNKDKKMSFSSDMADDILEDAYLFYELFPEEKVTKKSLLSFVFRDVKNLFLLIFIIGVFSSLLSLISPVATSYITGKIIPMANIPILVQISSLLIILFICQISISLIPSVVMMITSGKQFERFQSAIYDRILRIPINNLKMCDVGDMTSRVIGATKIQQSVFNVITQQFSSSLFALASLIMMFVYSKILAITALCMVFAYSLIFLFLSKLNIKPLTIKVAAAGRSNGLTKQFFEGISKIRAAGAEQRIISKFMNDFSIIMKEDYKISRIGACQDILTKSFPMFMSLIFYSIIGTTGENALPLPMFLAFIAAFQNFQGGVMGLASGVWTLLTIKPQLERIMPILEVEIDSSKDKQAVKLSNATIELSNISFRYEKDSPLVLRDVSIRANAGEFIAIVGSSGAGKSSLIRILLGFDKYESGTVYYSGKDMSTLNLRLLRKQLGVVLQNSKVMNASILENIIMGTTATKEDAMEALKLASFDKEVEAMPMGIHSVVNPENISGGQQQRILIARALVAKPVAVIMDESTSALDNITQEIVKKNMEKLSMTRIVIAHRLSTIINADRIYVLDKGRVVECGTYKELIQQNGVFKDLAKRQQLDS